MLGKGLVLFPVGAFLFACPLTARAYDVEVNLDTDFQAYQVRSPTTTAFWARRRLVDTLGMRYVQPLSDKQSAQANPRILVQLNLRLYQEFGETCLVADDVCWEATDSSEDGFYQPLARDSRIEAPLAYVEGDGLPFGLRIKAGRQLYWDRIGFARFDGGSAGIDPWQWLHLEVLGGAQVTNTSVAGSSAFVTQGIPRLKLESDERERASFIGPPINTWLLGAAVDAGLLKLIRVGVSFRELWGNEGIVQRIGGIGARSQPIDPLYLQTDAVWDFADFALVEGRVAAELQVGEMTWRLSGQRHVPRFDRGTIWAYFEVAPVWEEKFGASWSAPSELEIGGALCGRHTDFGKGYDHDAGLEGYTATRLGALRLGFSGFAWTGDLGPVWGANLDGARPVLSWLIFNGRVSLWRIDNLLRPEIQGFSLSETLGGSMRITANTKLSCEFSHAYSSVIGNRFWFFALLHLGAWR